LGSSIPGSGPDDNVTAVVETQMENSPRDFTTSRGSWPLLDYSFFDDFWREVMQSANVCKILQNIAISLWMAVGRVIAFEHKSDQWFVGIRQNEFKT
jgi:hypothetical protein